MPCGFCSCFAWLLKVTRGESLLGISLQIMESEGLSLAAILSCRSQPAAVHVQCSCQCLFGHTGRKIPVCWEFSYRPQRDGVCPRLRVSQQQHVGASFPFIKPFRPVPAGVFGELHWGGAVGAAGHLWVAVGAEGAGTEHAQPRGVLPSPSPPAAAASHPALQRAPELPGARPGCGHSPNTFSPILFPAGIFNEA